MTVFENFAHLIPFFERQKFIRHLDVNVTELDEGYCVLTLDYKAELSQADGIFDGGVVGALADNVAGAAATTLLKSEGRWQTAEYKINLLAPAKGKQLIATGKVLKSGRTLTVAESNIYAIDGSERRHCATALVTLIAAS